MAGTGTELGAVGSGMLGSGDTIKPSIGNALPYFASLIAFPLVACAVLFGGWWIAGPYVFLFLPDMLDELCGTNKKNMDPDKTSESQLLIYDMAIWTWAFLWPVTLLFALWQILVVGHLALWEALLIALGLAGVGRSAFIIGHEMAHRNAAWERGLSEFVLTSVAYPHYALEHLYGHHAHVCTPADSGSAPKGLSFWKYFPRDMVKGYTDAWRYSRNRLARRHLPVWHYTNPFWRYFLGTGAWFALVYWMGGAWALLVFGYLCFSMAGSLKTVNYIQHYGLQRIRLPGNRFEPVQTWHSWSVANRLTDWLFYNIQRHADHHTAANRRYPLLQYLKEEEVPQLPGGYVKMAFMVLSPRLWFKTMDPLVDRWRAHFYPQVKDWSAYDSPAFAARPNAFEAIDEILGASPRLGAWINHTPALLDNLQKKEFTNLELPDGFGPDPESEAAVRHGLVRLYWTHEFGVADMRERISDFPIHTPPDAVETARHWSNDQVFQIGMHAMRGNLTPSEAGIALTHVAEASLATVLETVMETSSGQGGSSEGSFAVVALGELASEETAPGATLDFTYVYDGGSSEYHEALFRCFRKELRSLSHGNLLLAPVPRRQQSQKEVRSLAGFVAYHQTSASTSELLNLTRARCIFTFGDAGIANQFDAARRDILADGTVRNALLDELRKVPENAPEPGLLSIRDMRGGLQDAERAARIVQLTHAGKFPDMLALNAVAVFQAAGAHGLGPDGATERLAEATRMWQNLQGILKLVALDDFTVETATPKTKAAIACACGVDDFESLDDAIRATAVRAEGDIKALMA